MLKITVTLLILACSCAGAGDVVLERAPEGATPGGGGDYDATAELKWDTGVPYWLVAWYTGAGVWVGNDFNVATLKTYSGVKKIRMFSGPAWPNGRWDGFNLALYAFGGGAPGSRLKGPWWAKGNSTGYAWNDFNVSWVLPTGVTAFVPACEQLYNYPNCDPFLLDNSPIFKGHSWIYYQGDWNQMNTSGNPYRNLMLRVVVDNEQNPAVAPASLGRVKALYF